MRKYFDISYILNQKDKDGNDPQFYVVCSTVRSAGKTYSISKKLLTDAVNDKNKKFILICRHINELGSVFAGIMKAMTSNEEEFKDYNLVEIVKSCYSYCVLRKTEQKNVTDKRGTEKTITVNNDIDVGYVLPISASGKIKNISSLFVDASVMFFDEFQPLTGGYLKNEVALLADIIKSVGRGGGEQTRLVPVILASNTLSLYNEYFKAMGIHKQVQSNTNLARGSGWVFQHYKNTELADEHDNTPLARALSNCEAIQYKSNAWLNDNNACICKRGDWGEGQYFCTLISNKQEFAVRFYNEVGLYYVDNMVDKTYPLRYIVTLDDMSPNLQLIKSRLHLLELTAAMENGLVRFKDNICKDMLIDMM